MSSNLRPARRQHIVTKCLLKGFTDAAGQLAVYERATQNRQLRSPGSGVFTVVFDSYDSRGAEEFWNRFETKFPAALDRVRSRMALEDAATVGTLKDLLALHWARSRAIMVAREPLMQAAIEGHKAEMLNQRPEMLARALRNELGILATSRSALEWMNDVTHERVVRNYQAKWHSDRNPINFAAARQHFEKFQLQLGYTNDRDLLISDCPVISTRRDRAGTGPHQGIAVEEADHIAMPIAPDVVAGLGPDAVELTLTNEAVDQYNAWQWEAYDTWIAARPGGTGDLGLKLAEALGAANSQRRLGPGPTAGVRQTADPQRASHRTRDG